MCGLAAAANDWRLVNGSISFLCLKRDPAYTGQQKNAVQFVYKKQARVKISPLHDQRENIKSRGRIFQFWVSRVHKKFARGSMWKDIQNISAFGCYTHKIVLAGASRHSVRDVLRTKMPGERPGAAAFSLSLARHFSLPCLRARESVWCLCSLYYFWVAYLKGLVIITLSI